MGEHKTFMIKAIELARESMESNEGGPFGAIVVKDGKIIGSGMNCVTKCNDPTAHAEVQAIRDACTELGHFQLTGCTIYSSCEPCPMCLGAIYWARPDALYFGASKLDAANIGFDDSYIYEEIELGPEERHIPTHQLLGTEAVKVFSDWDGKEDKTEY